MYDLLAGMRVVEAAAFIAGPSCGLHLAQMGAQVIRIDQIGGGPDFRRWPLAPGGGASLYWEGLNKAKQSVALDLTRPEGRALAARIATAPGDDAGLFVTNFPVEGFLAYERLRALRQDLICVRIMGWPDGRPAVDYTVNSAVGVPFMTGPADDDRPVNHVLPAWDLMAGAYAAFALVAAERSRRAGGGGREVRIPLSDLAIASLGHLGQIAETTLGDGDRPRMGNDLYGAFGRDFITADGRGLWWWRSPHGNGPACWRLWTSKSPYRRLRRNWASASPETKARASPIAHGWRRCSSPPSPGDRSRV